MTTFDLFMDQIAAMPGERAADAMRMFIDTVNESPLSYDERRALVEYVTARLNEACARRDALAEREGHTLQ